MDSSCWSWKRKHFLRHRDEDVKHLSYRSSSAVLSGVLSPRVKLRDLNEDAQALWKCVLIQAHRRQDLSAARLPLKRQSRRYRLNHRAEPEETRSRAAVPPMVETAVKAPLCFLGGRCLLSLPLSRRSPADVRTLSKVHGLHLHWDLPVKPTLKICSITELCYQHTAGYSKGASAVFILASGSHEALNAKHLVCTFVCSSASRTEASILMKHVELYCFFKLFKANCVGCVARRHKNWQRSVKPNLKVVWKREESSLC